jgi:riboflavin kinase/FMN adenylyltransferase
MSLELSRKAAAVKPSSTLAITAKAKELRAQGKDVVGFGAGEPDFNTPENICDAAIQAIHDGFTKYTPASGTNELKEAVSKKFKSFNGLDYAPDQIVISSTYIRDVLSQGNVTLAAELLGYRYGVTGIVRHGRQLGRTLGFPTMNVEPEEKKILPRFGVYVCRINIDGKWYNGIGNVGVKPTVTEEHKRLVEVFVYDYEGDAYGKEITVEFCDFERPEIRFSSVNELKKQVAKDLRYGKDYFKASKEI